MLAADSGSLLALAVASLACSGGKNLLPVVSPNTPLSSWEKDLRQNHAICILVLFHEIAEDHAINVLPVALLEEIPDFADCCLRSFITRVSIDSRAQCRKGNATQAVFFAELQRAAVAAAQQLLMLALSLFFPIDWPNGMDDLSSWQAIAVGDLCVTSGTSVENLAFPNELRASSAVDGAVDSAAAEERFVCGIDDGIDFELGDVVANEANFRVEDYIRFMHGGRVDLKTLGAVEKCNGGDLVERNSARHGARVELALDNT